MENKEIKDYILKYKDSYSKKSLEKRLKESGASKTQIDSIYIEIKNTSKVKIKFDDKTKNFTNKFTFFSLISIITLIIIFIIIGALVFTNIDFKKVPSEQELKESELNSKYSFKLNNDLSASVLGSFANSLNNEITLLFTYNGTNIASFNINSSNIILKNTKNTCNSTYIKNLNTNLDSDKFDDLYFLNKNKAILKLNCKKKLNPNEIFIADIKITYIDIKSNISKISSGTMKLKTI